MGKRPAAALLVIGVLAVAAAGACGSSGARSEPPRASIETVPVTRGPVPAVIAGVGTTLVGIVAKDGVVYPDDHLVVSTDDGGTWSRRALSGVEAGEQISLAGPFDLDGSLALSARRFSVVDENRPDAPFPNGPVWVWTSDDGRSWRGGTVQDYGPVIVHPTVLRIGDTLLFAVSDGTTLFVSSSRDGGRRWTRTAVSGVRLDPKRA